MLPKRRQLPWQPFRPYRPCLSSGLSTCVSSQPPLCRVCFQSGCHNLKRSIRRGTLECQGFGHWRLQPSLALLMIQKQHRHGLFVNRFHFSVGPGCKKRKEKVVAAFASALAEEGAPNPCEEKQRPGLVQSKPLRHRLAGGPVVFAEAGEGHQATVAFLKPGLPPFAFCISNI